MEQLQRGLSSCRAFAESEAQHNQPRSVNQVFARDRRCDPLPEFGQTFRGQAKNLSATKTGALLDPATYQPFLFEPSQCRIDCAGAVAVGFHGSRSEDLAQAIA